MIFFSLDHGSYSASLSANCTKQYSIVWWIWSANCDSLRVAIASYSVVPFASKMIKSGPVCTKSWARLIDSGRVILFVTGPTTSVIFRGPRNLCCWRQRSSLREYHQVADSESCFSSVFIYEELLRGARCRKIASCSFIAWCSKISRLLAHSVAIGQAAG